MIPALQHEAPVSQRARKEHVVANFNRQADNRKRKTKRRRREVERKIAVLQAGGQKHGDQPADLPRKIRNLKRSMRYEG
jgi:hypothetical protein